MLSPMTSSLPAPAPTQRAQAPAARERAADHRAADEAPHQGFDQAMDKAQSPDGAQRQAARLRQARQAAADNGKVRGPAEQPKTAPPSQAGGKDATTLPPEAETEDASPVVADAEPAALLAQLQTQAQAQAARGARGARGEAATGEAGSNGQDGAASAVDATGVADRALAAQRAAVEERRGSASKDRLDKGEHRDSRLARAADDLSRTATAAADATLALQAHSEDRAAAAQLQGAATPASVQRAAAEAGSPSDAVALPAPLGGAGTQAPTPGAAAVAEAQLPAGLDSPDFATHLAAQVSTFVRDGIEHARLHLNPAEMGPVSVQIQLDGQMAVVHLGAEQAQTRQALEQALPQLAGQLREAGLTLTGGGVFEQAPQGREGAAAGQGDGRSGSPGSPGTWGRGDDRRLDDAGAPLARLPQRRGVVDLVA
jgi:flagellar hook-length control protein FliK